MYAGIGITTAWAVVTSTTGFSVAALLLFAALDPLHADETTARTAMQLKTIPKTIRFLMIYLRY
jgi:hypothetical protein